MLFKNAVIYSFTTEFSIDTEKLVELMLENEFQPVGSQERSRTGWVSSLPGTPPDGVFETVCSRPTTAFSSGSGKTRKS